MNIEAFISTLYRKFPGQMNDKIAMAARDLLDISDDDDDIDVLIGITEIDSINDKEVISEISSYVGKSGNRKVAEKIDEIVRKIEEKEKKSNKKVRYFWLNDKVKGEIMGMQGQHRSALKRMMDVVADNPSLLDANYSFVGFVDSKRHKNARDFKKHGSNGFRVGFVLVGSDPHRIVIVRNIGSKSTSELSDADKEDIFKLANKVVNDGFQPNMEEISGLGEIDESTSQVDAEVESLITEAMLKLTAIF